MKILVKYIPNEQAYGLCGDLALEPGEDWFVVPTTHAPKALRWIEAHPNFFPAGRTVRFFLEDGSELI